MNRYEWKQECRRARLEARAERLRQEGNGRINRARAMADCIPFGQPILVGHHSEKRDRSFRAKIHNNFAKGFDALKAAGAVEARAAAVGTGGISSDDPDAVAKLAEQLAAAEAKQARMVAANKALRRRDDAGLATLGFSPLVITKLKEPDCAGRVGFADFELTNNGANIRRIKARIAALERAATREPKELEHASGVRLVENVEANRVQLFFPGKPAAATRELLKRHGFRWSPSEGAWQRHLNGSGVYAARHVLSVLP